MSDLGGAQIQQLLCHVPPSGAWWATTLLVNGTTAPPLGRTTLQIGADLLLVGDVVRQGFDATSQPRAVVRGGAGWWLPLARAETWQSDAGVKLRTVLAALQRAAATARAATGLGGGETLAMPPDASLGSAYGWPAASAERPSTGAMALGTLVTRGALVTWRIEPAGGTVFTPWPSIGAADNLARVMRRNSEVGRRELGLDTRVAAFLPGCTIEGTQIRRTLYRELAGHLTAEVWDR